MSMSFERLRVAADLAAAGELRCELDQWLCEALALPVAFRYDVVLAVYEAMANAALHAYRDVAPPHTMAVEAYFDASSGVLTVTDRGRWREQDTTDVRHGRGITLMRGLADSVSVNTSPNGTRAHMNWKNVSAPVGTPSSPMTQSTRG